jgi:7-cyano-7-deazaguanine synthase
MNVIVLLSGGMDSSTALAWSLHEGHTVVGCLSFDYGSKHNDTEYQYATTIAEHFRVPIRRASLDFIAETFKSDLLKSGGDIPESTYDTESMKRTVVPFRNGIMLSIAAGYAESVGAQGVVLANHFADHAIYPDCRVAFIDPMRAAIKAGTDTQIELLSPFASIDKSEIARIGARLGVPFTRTYSCYKGGPKHCGVCGTCRERKRAFAVSGISDPTEYAE